MTRQRRGRPTRELRQKESVKQVMDLYRHSRHDLEISGAFADACGVQSLIAALPPGTAWKHGVGLDLIRRGAVRYMLEALDPDDPAEARLQQFIQAFFRERRTITAIVSDGTLGRAYTREHVSKTIAARAQVMVTQRFLTLVETERPQEVSVGVQVELDAFKQRRGRPRPTAWQL